MFTLIRASKHLILNGIQGDFVECGVWKGGSVMAMAMTLDRLKEHRDILLFDTFSGMPTGCNLDRDFDGHNESWYRDKSGAHSSAGSEPSWNAVSLQDVQKNLSQIGQTLQKFHFFQGKVEDTLPHSAPDKIALLRLDTDFYSSTKHDLVCLFPRLAKGGILIVDDYGHFLGARKAVDEYFQENDIRMFLTRIDYTAVVGVKS